MNDYILRGESIDTPAGKSNRIKATVIMSIVALLVLLTILTINHTRSPEANFKRHYKSPQSILVNTQTLQEKNTITYINEKNESVPLYYSNEGGLLFQSTDKTTRFRMNTSNGVLTSGRLQIGNTETGINCYRYKQEFVCAD